MTKEGAKIMHKRWLNKLNSNDYDVLTDCYLKRDFKRNNKTLMLSYNQLKTMLETMQNDGSVADGFSLLLKRNADEEIQNGIRKGIIKVFNDKN